MRFAPSPTGDFHLGNFRTAWISHGWARELGLPWVVRFEDIDVPRVVAGAQAKQLSEMERLGLVPDLTQAQSEFAPRHWDLFLRGVRERKIYPCFCSRLDVRRDLEGAGSAPHAETPLYSGHCRELTLLPATDLPSLAWRFKNTDASGRQDFIVARTSTHLDARHEPGRESFAPAYNWACAVDDFDGAYDLLVRAWDLEGVLDQQRRIQSLLGEWLGTRSPAAVFHTSLIVSNDGHRLEKRTAGVKLPELLASGETLASIVAKFERSFSIATCEYGQSKILGESKRTRTLKELGF